MDEQNHHLKEYGLEDGKDHKHQGTCTIFWNTYSKYLTARRDIQHL